MLGGSARDGTPRVNGKGARLYDQDGKDYTDCTSQGWAERMAGPWEDYITGQEVSWLMGGGRSTGNRTIKYGAQVGKVRE